MKPTLIKAGTIVRNLGGGTLYLGNAEVSPSQHRLALTQRTAERCDEDTWVTGDGEIELIPETPTEVPTEVVTEAPKKAAPKKAVAKKAKPAKAKRRIRS